MTMFKYWGKTRLGDKSEGDDYHLLAWHSLDVAATGYWMLENNIYHTRDYLSQLGFSSNEAMIDFLMWLLCCHDIGKFAHAFQQKYRHKDLGTADTSWVRYSDVHHTALGYWLWKEIIPDFSDAYPKSELEGRKLEEVINRWMAISTGHHGAPPELINTSNHFHDENYVAVKDFLKEILKLFPQAEIPTHWHTHETREIIKLLSWPVSAIVVLADWIGSNCKYFPRVASKMPLEVYWKIALENAREAILHLPKSPLINKFSGIKNLFPFISQPTPLQQIMQDIDITADGPHLFILEDVTGAGKTEAALILTHRLMSAQKARGVFVGLPTMATANAMYQRLYTTARKFYQDESKPSLILAHSARHLSDLFSQSVWLDETEGTEEPDDVHPSTQGCAAWFAQSNKKALLADIGVGTIDQAMMAVIPFRHHNLRLLGLNDKVLIIDEIHAYDTFMSKILEDLVETQARYGNSAILLSATLSQSQRERLVAAFSRGTGKSLSAPFLSQHDYPWVTHVASGEIHSSPVATRKEVMRRVAVDWLHSETECITALLDAVAKGECIAWIRNSVDDAVRIYGLLISSGKVNPENVLLFHSRFAFCDRQVIENKTLRWFGKQECSHRAGKVIIATQVIEQSLDLDFDRMITDLAPVDLLIQRAGRLQRHIRNRKGELKSSGEDERSSPVLTIYSPEWADDPQPDWLSSVMRNSAYIYPDHAKLWLTQRTLREQQEIRMPEFARILIEAVYGDGITVPPGLARSANEQEGKYYCDLAIAEQQSVNFAAGYAPGVNDMMPEKLATRLAEESITLWLAKQRGDDVVPWAQGENAWEMSSLHVRKSWWLKHEQDFSMLAGEALQKWCSEQKQVYANVVLVTAQNESGYSSEEGLMGKGITNDK
ncbi:CRISPR-associated helicase Cas3' [Atlantibacter subterraneus]|uniref:CRISPR-associated helicase Cas3' n=1 Tax=Atlantibacter subterraneus TaxID=255519 RepID=UPI0029644062|nr:CRISPR-associated helicase Cas3' [Atlantibacter subterranea]MDW2741850.1 CRISPR-associated helicase Cas3' [Atlantibacter subterranea]